MRFSPKKIKANRGGTADSYSVCSSSKWTESAFFEFRKERDITNMTMQGSKFAAHVCDDFDGVTSMVTGKYAVKAKVVSLTGGKHSLNATNVRKDRNHLDSIIAIIFIKKVMGANTNQLTIHRCNFTRIVTQYERRLGGCEAGD